MQDRYWNGDRSHQNAFLGSSVTFSSFYSISRSQWTSKKIQFLHEQKFQIMQEKTFNTSTAR
jgi:hypothetical protein